MGDFSNYLIYLFVMFVKMLGQGHSVLPKTFYVIFVNNVNNVIIKMISSIQCWQYCNCFALFSSSAACLVVCSEESHQSTFLICFKILKSLCLL